MKKEARCALVLAREAASRPIDSVLDVGCATGDHAAFVARAGVGDVEGIDFDRRLISIARAKHPDVRFRAGDMTTARLGRGFDAILSFYGVIAYVRTRAGLRRFAANVARHLEPGGAAVVEPWHLAGDYRPAPTARHVVMNGVAITRASAATVKDREVRLDVHYLVARGTRVRHLREVHRLGLFTREELLDAFRRAGLQARWSDAGPSDRGALIASKMPSVRG
jgi:SAM-dependent methyltransferase